MRSKYESNVLARRGRWLSCRAVDREGGRLLRIARWPRTCASVRSRALAAAALVCLCLAQGRAQGASSRDYPGPCAGEVNAQGVPLFLSSDYHGVSTAFGVVILPTTGRFKLGISCVATGFVVVRVGPDSALCTQRGRCTPDQLQGLTQADIEAVASI